MIWSYRIDLYYRLLSVSTTPGPNFMHIVFTRLYHRFSFSPIFVTIQRKELYVCWQHLHQQLPQPVARCLHRKHPGHVDNIACPDRYRIAAVVDTSAHACAVVALTRRLHECLVAQQHVLGARHPRRPWRQRAGVGELRQRSLGSPFRHQSGEGPVVDIRRQLSDKTRRGRTAPDRSTGNGYPDSTSGSTAGRRTHHAFDSDTYRTDKAREGRTERDPR